MKLMTRFLFALSFLLFSIASMADTNMIGNTVTNNPNVSSNLSNPEKGFYVGADLGGGDAKCSQCSFNLFSVSSTLNHGATITAFGGYQFNRYLAAEAGVGALPPMKYTLSFPEVVYSRTMHSAHAYLALKGILPIGKEFSLFGKFGVDSQRLTYSEPVTDNAVRISASGTFMALGAGYNFTPNWTGTASYNQILGSNSGVDYTTRYIALGFTYLIF